MYFGGQLDIAEIFNFLLQEGRTVIYLVASAYALYFYHTKIGFRLSITYEVSGDAYTDSQITKLVVSNHKDKVVPIWSIYMVLENDVKVEVYKPAEPVVLKPGEAMSIAPEKYTSLSIGGDHFKPHFFNRNVDFYINVGNKLVKCKDRKFKDSFLEKIPQAHKTRMLFDGHLYNENVDYILVYFLDGKKYTAYIDNRGFIGHEWGLSPNTFGQTTVTPGIIEKMLEHYGYTSIFSNYVCFKCNGNDFDVVFKKRT
ncbi:hypothetical protein BZG25_00545 [Salinivibrio sp. ML198]|nr:hypothetical protein BZG25_00545 [Salinivibrio sp. ML198]